MEQEQKTTDEILHDEELLSQEARLARWQSRRPPIDHLPDGLHVDHVTGDIVPLFDVGDRVVVDRRTNLLKGIPWLETIVGKVRSIDDEKGLVQIYDEDSDPRNPPVRYTSFLDGFHTFKLAPARGNPFAPPPPPKKEKPQRVPGQKGRGRPKGARNRSTEAKKARDE